MIRKDLEDIASEANIDSQSVQEAIEYYSRSQNHIVSELKLKYSLGERNFGGMNLSHQDLSKMNLAYGNFQDADLSHAVLRGANLDYADLGRANLRNANLREASLNKACLEKANLTDVDLSLANLNHSNMVNSTILRVKVKKTLLEGATLPDGSTWDSPFPLSKGIFDEQSLIQTSKSNDNTFTSVMSGIFLILVFLGLELVSHLLSGY